MVGQHFTRGAIDTSLHSGGDEKVEIIKTSSNFTLSRSLTSKKAFLSEGLRTFRSFTIAMIVLSFGIFLKP